MKNNPREYYIDEIKKISEKIGVDKCNQLIVDWIFDNVSRIEKHILDHLEKYIKEND